MEQGVGERPEKRQRLSEGHEAAAEEAEGPPPGPPPAEQLKAALQKIANHISSSAKFPKASALLRQVMDAVDKSHRWDRGRQYCELSAALQAAWNTLMVDVVGMNESIQAAESSLIILLKGHHPAHLPVCHHHTCHTACLCSVDFFAAVKAAFTHPEHCTDPLLRKDYVRLMKAVNLRSEVFSKQQRAQLEVYSILVSTQGVVWSYARQACREARTHACRQEAA
jgi:hypothetical protein